MPLLQNKHALLMTWIKFVCLFHLIQSTVVLADLFDRKGQPLSDTMVNSDQVNWRLLSQNETDSFSGVGLLREDVDGWPRCSGALIEMGDAKTSGGEKPAYILTAGHCVHEVLSSYQKIAVDQAVKGLSFCANYTYDHKENLCIKIKRAVYAARNFYDLAVLELALSVEEMKALGFQPLQMGDAHVGDAVNLIAVPARGLEPSKVFLRKATCILENPGIAFIERTESRDWFFEEFWTRCSTIEGSSGGPFISKDSDKIVGIVKGNHNTRHFTTMEPLNTIAGCFTKEGLFNLDAPSCQVERPCVLFGQGLSCKKHYEDLCYRRQAGWACFFLAQDFYHGVKSDVEVEKAMARACDLGSAMACWNIAGIISKNKSHLYNKKQLNEFYRKSCKKGVPGGCFNLAVSMYYGKDGSIEDREEAKKFYAQSCKLGLANACYVLAEYYHWPRGSRSRLDLYKQACDQGFQKGCARYAALTHGREPPIERGGKPD